MEAGVVFSPLAVGGRLSSGLPEMPSLDIFVLYGFARQDRTDGLKSDALTRRSSPGPPA